jgi:hypothetical protein
MIYATNMQSLNMNDSKTFMYLQYASLIFELSVAHIGICAMHIPSRGQASRAQVGPTCYQWRIFYDMRH